jgi:hypothetical protein
LPRYTWRCPFCSAENASSLLYCWSCDRPSDDSMEILSEDGVIDLPSIPQDIKQIQEDSENNFCQELLEEHTQFVIKRDPLPRSISPLPELIPDTRSLHSFYLGVVLAVLVSALGFIWFITSKDIFASVVSTKWVHTAIYEERIVKRAFGVPPSEAFKKKCKDRQKLCRYSVYKWVPRANMTLSGSDSKSMEWPDLGPTNEKYRTLRSSEYIVEMKSKDLLFRIKIDGPEMFTKFEVGQRWLCERLDSGIFRAIRRVN